MEIWLYSGWPVLAETAAKALLMYAVALVGLRLALRRALAQWSAIDFAAAGAVGAIVGRSAIAGTQTFAVGAVALAAILLAHRGVSAVRLRSGFGRLLDHRVRVLVDHGRLREDQLRRCGLTRGDVLARLRQDGVQRLDQVRYLLYEAKGELTVVHETGGPDAELVREGLTGAAGHPGAGDRPGAGSVG